MNLLLQDVLFSFFLDVELLLSSASISFRSASCFVFDFLRLSSLASPPLFVLCCFKCWKCTCFGTFERVPFDSWSIFFVLQRYHLGIFGYFRCRYKTFWDPNRHFSSHRYHFIGKSIHLRSHSKTPWCVTKSEYRFLKSSTAITPTLYKSDLLWGHHVLFWGCSPLHPHSWLFQKFDEHHSQQSLKIDQHQPSIFLYKQIEGLMSRWMRDGWKECI